MPTYDYQCARCGHTFEKYQTITAEPVKQCPECGGAVERLLGAGAAIISKGGSSPSSCPTGTCPVPSGQAPCYGKDSPCLRP